MPPNIVFQLPDPLQLPLEHPLIPKLIQTQADFTVATGAGLLGGSEAQLTFTQKHDFVAE